MNGAESLVRTLLACGVEVCFANPGTSEMHFCAALDRAPGMRCVLGLFEGVVTGAADGYGRMTGKPAATLLHCGPGLANGIAYLHNASRAHTPIVNIVGDQATYHAHLDPPLATDTEGLAKPFSRWVKKVMRSETLGSDAAAAIRAARTPPYGIATLILPSDVSWNQGGVVAGPLPVRLPARPSQDAIKDAAKALRSGEPALILLIGAALAPGPLADAHRIAAATGARVMAPTVTARIARVRGRHLLDIVPYPVDVSVQLLAGLKHLILVGTGEPVAFFAYPGKPGIVVIFWKLSPFDFHLRTNPGLRNSIPEPRIIVIIAATDIRRYHIFLPVFKSFPILFLTREEGLCLSSSSRCFMIYSSRLSIDMFF
jgi:acetolactate synthase-1/2/3 large subunit